jgi:hypothetical protein
MKVNPTHLIFISMIIFFIINVTENLIHYNIGKGINGNGFVWPSVDDWIKIIITMIIFGYLQGYLTEYISERY